MFRNFAPFRSILHDLDISPSPSNADLRGLDVGFIPPLPPELPYMASNDGYVDEYNVEYLSRDVFCRLYLFARCYHSRYQNWVHWSLPGTMFLFSVDTLTILTGTMGERSDNLLKFYQPSDQVFSVSSSTQWFPNHHPRDTLQYGLRFLLHIVAFY